MSFLAATWTLSGYDVAAHVAEETHDASRTVPLAIIWSTWSSTALGFVYLISLALCATDIDSLMANPLGQPIGTLTADVLGLKAGIVMLAISFVSQFGCGVAFVSALATTYLCLPLTLYPPVCCSEPYFLCVLSRQSPSLFGLAQRSR